MNRQTDIHAGRKTCRQTDMQTDRWGYLDRQSCGQTNMQTDRHAGRHTGRPQGVTWTDRQTDTQARVQTDHRAIWTDTQAGKQISSHIQTDHG